MRGSCRAMRSISHRLTLCVIAVTLGLAMPADAQSPAPAPSPVCPPLGFASSPVWTFHAPGQTCSSTIRTKNSGSLTVANVDSSMISVDPMTGLPTVDVGGTSFTVTSGAKGGQTKFTVNFAGDPGRNNFVYHTSMTVTVINKY